MRVGYHLPVSKGFSAVPNQAKQTKSATIQIFTRSPRAWAAKEIAPDEAAGFKQGIMELDITPVAVHSMYLINLATDDSDLRRKSIKALADEMQRTALLGGQYVITHVGSAGDSTRPAAIKRVAQAVDQVVKRTPKTVQLLLENSAGAGDLIGCETAELAAILDAAKHGDRVGVCVDSCHAFASGYAVTAPDGLDRYLEELDKYVGLERLKVIHLNDSKAAFDSRKDLHANLGKGTMGKTGLALILNHPRLRSLPFIMETPWKKGAPDPADMRTAQRLIVR